MTFILVLLLATNNQVESYDIAIFDKMDECFHAREKIVEMTGRPVINYQAICVAHKKLQSI